MRDVVKSQLVLCVLQSIISLCSYDITGSYMAATDLSRDGFDVDGGVGVVIMFCRKDMTPPFKRLSIDRTTVK